MGLRQGNPHLAVLVEDHEWKDMASPRPICLLGDWAGPCADAETAIASRAVTMGKRCRRVNITFNEFMGYPFSWRQLEPADELDTFRRPSPPRRLVRVQFGEPISNLSRR
jgi:hypothetical protein